MRKALYTNAKTAKTQSIIDGKVKFKRDDAMSLSRYVRSVCPIFMTLCAFAVFAFKFYAYSFFASAMPPPYRDVATKIRCHGG